MKVITAFLIGSVVNFVTIVFLAHTYEIEHAIIPALQCWYCQDWQAPYGLLWYVINTPMIYVIPSVPLGSYILLIFYFNIAFMILIRNHKLLFVSYIPITILMLRQAMYNVSILWLTGLGLINPWLLLLPIIAKFPDTIAGWNYILHNSIQLQSNWRYYGLMGLWWMLVLLERKQRLTNYLKKVLESAKKDWNNT